MKLLVLGGTVFLGRHLVDAALAAGHEVTLFNRGRTNPDLFPGVPRIHGARDGGLGNLRLSCTGGRQWDAVIDTSGYVPRVVGDSAKLLADSVGHYTFVSSVSVYDLDTRCGADENWPVAQLPADPPEEITGETYGRLKFLCEEAAEAALPGRTLRIRPGLIVGPHDPSDRFTYWVRRVTRGGRILAPGSSELLVQFIDARDLAGWMLAAAERQVTGVFNATGPADPLPIGHLLDTCREVCGSDATFTYVSEEFLRERGVMPYLEMPLWVPEEAAGMNALDCSRARAAGLTLRPVRDTVQDTLDWYLTDPKGSRVLVGLPAEREQALLDAWDER